MSIAPSPDAARASAFTCQRRVWLTAGEKIQRLTLVLLAAFPLTMTGCSSWMTSGLKGPGMPGLTSRPQPGHAELQANYVPVGTVATLPSGAFTQEVYQSVRNAKANNSIVLQVLDDEVPIRVLPLPSAEASPSQAAAAGSAVGGRSVFVSTLLAQTGVMRKLGRAQAALYRPSPENYEGIRMDILFSENDTEQVRPESDYALRPGDRLVIRKDDRLGMASLLDMVLKR